MNPVPSPRAHRPVFRPRILDLFRGGYGLPELGADVVAGLTVGLIALPLALALGIASVPDGAHPPFSPPALGLYTAIIGGFLISAFGGSRVQIGGPTAAFIPVVLLVIDRHGYSGLVLATIMAGVILVIMGLTRMGTLIKYIPWPVTSGFTTGIAVSILATQAADFFGIRADSPAPREFIGRMGWLAQHFDSLHAPTLGLSVACLALILLWPRFGARRVPGTIIAMLGATVLVALWAGGGIATVGSRFGAAVVPAGLPGIQFPTITLALIRDLIGPATAIALLGAIESLLSAVVADGLTADRHDSNTELIAQGIANIACPLFGGLPATGAIARTSANVNSGGRTPVAGLVHAGTLLLVVVALSGQAARVPLPAMAAVLVAVALRMGEWHELARLRRMPRSDAAVLVTTFALTVVFDLVIAVEVGMVLAAMLFIRRVSETTEVSRVTGEDVLESPAQMAHGKSIPDGVLVYRIFGPFLFGAAEKMEDALERIGLLPRVLILRLHLVTAMDATALNAMESVVERMKAAHGTVVISGIHRQPFDLLRKAGFIEVIGRENFRGTFDEALVRARELLEPGRS